MNMAFAPMQSGQYAPMPGMIQTQGGMYLPLVHAGHGPASFDGHLMGPHGGFMQAQSLHAGSLHRPG
jgi:hypothetical protein